MTYRDLLKEFENKDRNILYFRFKGSCWKSSRDFLVYPELRALSQTMSPGTLQIYLRCVSKEAKYTSRNRPFAIKALWASNFLDKARIVFMYRFKRIWIRDISFILAFSKEMSLVAVSVSETASTLWPFYWHHLRKVSANFAGPPVSGGNMPVATQMILALLTG